MELNEYFSIRTNIYFFIKLCELHNFELGSDESFIATSDPVLMCLPFSRRRKVP